MFEYFLGPVNLGVLKPIFSPSIEAAAAHRMTWIMYGDEDLRYPRGNKLFVYENRQLVTLVDYDELWDRSLKKRRNKKGVWPYTSSISGIVERYVRRAVYHAKKTEVRDLLAGRSPSLVPGESGAF